jgi:hypothetical protein
MFSNHLDRAGAALLSSHTGHIVQPFIAASATTLPQEKGDGQCSQLMLGSPSIRDAYGRPVDVRWQGEDGRLRYRAVPPGLAG